MLSHNEFHRMASCAQKFDHNAICLDGKLIKCKNLLGNTSPATLRHRPLIQAYPWKSWHGYIARNWKQFGYSFSYIHVLMYAYIHEKNMCIYVLTYNLLKTCVIKIILKNLLKVPTWKYDRHTSALWKSFIFYQFFCQLIWFIFFRNVCYS